MALYDAGTRAQGESMLSHANNRNREGDISVSAADAWLKRNPQRTAEHMTGKLAPDAVIRKLRRSTNHACTPRNPNTLLENYKKRRKV